MPGYKIYGNKAALSVELTRTRESNRFPKGEHTLSFEMASFDSANSSAGASWHEKIIVQVTPMELPQVIAVLTGHLTEIEFKSHGKHSDKSYKLSPTRLNVSCPGTSHSVHLHPHDRFQISSLAMKQLQRSHGSLSSDLIYQLITDCYRIRKDKPNE